MKETSYTRRQLRNRLRQYEMCLEAPVSIIHTFDSTNEEVMEQIPEVWTIEEAAVIGSVLAACN